MEDEENNAAMQMVLDTIKSCYLNSTLPQLLGEALGKDAILVALMDTPGAVLIIANHRPGVLREKRNGIMMRQMAELLHANMDAMMKKASQEAREEEMCLAPIRDGVGVLTGTHCGKKRPCPDHG